MAVVVMNGDCRYVVPTLGQFDLVFADPPFNIGFEYRGYKDKRSDYAEFTEEWIAACWAACRGVLCLHGPDNLVYPYLAAADRLGMRRIDWVNWYYGFGQNGDSKFVDSRCHCVIFAKNDKWTWNPDEVLVKSARLLGGDKRVLDSSRGGLKVPGTVWGFKCDEDVEVEEDVTYWGRVQGNNEERRKQHGNQLPERYLERIIRAYTNPGDRILDPFAGSGTTAVVGDCLGCDVVTIDVSEDSCESVRERVKIGTKRVQKRGQE